MNRFLLLLIFIITINFLHAQNILDTSDWQEGNYDYTDFNAIYPVFGTRTINRVSLESNHLGVVKNSWKTDHTFNPFTMNPSKHGWGTNYKNLSDLYDYRFSVWVKTNNFGNLVIRAKDLIKNFRKGSTNYDVATFFLGDLPIKDRWYLIVGYIYRSAPVLPPINSSIRRNLGGIYDGVTGKRVSSINDYTRNSSNYSISF
ncbi:hypothetical protein [Mesonia aestuariivivens]|uniref:DUF2490 domain-containing protein n=1 Tax=Mesonia aestuariivivens TaxID=2796128 RepID=A0ABS6W265_9FLAO|nr:hypothetical protein [Mesonia aestuariivivens]MBW2961953.1 hypothetical protein [Mesonia aestuariivivens]